jgi:hypothetical protein
MAKIQLDIEKTKVAKIQQQLNIIKMQKELADSKDEVSKKILSMLDELTAPNHPADQLDLGGM